MKQGAQGSKGANWFNEFIVRDKRRCMMKLERENVEERTLPLNSSKTYVTLVPAVSETSL